MFTLNSLPKTTIKGKKRLGRGYGSGKGSHTSSRGQKGQKTRDTVKLFFEGTKSNKDFFRRTPMLRGKDKLKSNKPKPILIKLSALDIFSDGSVIDSETVIKANFVTARDLQTNGIKVIFDKAIDKKFDLRLPASKTVSNHLKV